jgi:hypothetical protein
VGSYGFADHSINLAFTLGKAGALHDCESTVLGYELVTGIPETETYNPASIWLEGKPGTTHQSCPYSLNGSMPHPTHLLSGWQLRVESVNCCK